MWTSRRFSRIAGRAVAAVIGVLGVSAPAVGAQTAPPVINYADEPVTFSLGQDGLSPTGAYTEATGSCLFGQSAGPGAGDGQLALCQSPVATPVRVRGANLRSSVAQTLGASIAWDFLEQEAANVIGTVHGVPDDRDIADWSRGLVRAWMLQRLYQIIKKPASARTLSEQGAYAHLRSLVWANQKAVVDQAISQYGTWRRAPCAFKPPEPYDYAANKIWCSGFGLPQLFSGLPAPPGAADFYEYGARKAADDQLGRITSDLAAVHGISDSAAKVVATAEARRAGIELRDGLDLLRILEKGITDGRTDLAGDGENPLSDEAFESVTGFLRAAAVQEAAFDLLTDLAGLMIEGSGNLGFLITYQVVLLAEVIWQEIDLETIDDKLFGVRDKIYATPPDLESMLSSEGGRLQILGLVLNETLHDHLLERKRDLSTPPAPSVGDLRWERTGRADVAWEAVERVPGLAVRDWRRPLDPSADRDVTVSTRDHWLLLEDPEDVKIFRTDLGAIQVNSPQRALSFGFTGWDGDHWMAWRAGTTFLQVKHASPLHPADSPLPALVNVVESIEHRCPPTVIKRDDASTGLDCVVWSGSVLNQTKFSDDLRSGDVVQVGDETRQVAGVVSDHAFLVSKPFSRTRNAVPIERLADLTNCWSTRVCFESDEIHYRSATDEIKARLVGNRAPTVDPRVTGRLAPATAVGVVPLLAGAPLRVPVVAAGFVAGTDVQFEASPRDPDGDPLTTQWTFEPGTDVPCRSEMPHACSVQSESARFRWDVPGTYAVSVVVTDPDGARSTWSRSITIHRRSQGHKPAAGDDKRSTPEDTPIDIFVGVNDFDVDNDLDLTTARVTDARQGTWEHLGGGRVRYTPSRDFTGRADAGYEVCDETGLCDDALIAVDVTAVNDPPVARDDTGSTSRDTPVVLDPFANDTDVENGLVGGSLVRQCIYEGPHICSNENPSLHGTWDAGGGKVTFTPAAGYVGPASYRYRICDTGSLCASGTIRVTVRDNQRPLVVDDHAVMLEDGDPIKIDVLANDNDPDGAIVPESLAPVSCGTFNDPGWLLCFITSLNALQGDWDMTTDHRLSYKPPAGFSSNYTTIPPAVRYQVCDDSGACASARADVTIRPVNDAPSFTAGPDVTADEDAGPREITWATDLRAGPVDEADQTLTFVASAEDRTLFSQQPSIDATGTLRFTSAVNRSGSTRVSVLLRDSGGVDDGGDDTSLPSVFTITIDPVNDPPVPRDDVATTKEDRPVMVDVLANDSDVEDDELRIEAASIPSLGTAKVVAGTSIRYVPDPGRTGTDRFDYEVCDTGGACGFATVTVTIREVNKPPSVTVGHRTATVQYGDRLAPVTFTATDPDDASSELRLSASGLREGLEFTDNGDGTGVLAGTAGARPGWYEIRVRVRDPSGLTNGTAFVLTVKPENARVVLAPTNPAAIKVVRPEGTSGSVRLTALVSETVPDLPAATAATGDIDRAKLRIVLIPVGDGAWATGACATSTGTLHWDERAVTCTFSNLAVNTYRVRARVGGVWYRGSDEDVLTVYDPSRGYATGGGRFTWPGTTDRTSFGFTMTYNARYRQIEGGVLVVRHRADGTFARLRSTMLNTLSIGEDSHASMAWVSLTGAGSYKESDAGRAVGGYSYALRAEDRNEPGGGTDRIWLRVVNSGKPTALTMVNSAVDNTAALTEGNVVVPHGPSG